MAQVDAGRTPRNPRIRNPQDNNRTEAPTCPSRVPPAMWDRKRRHRRLVRVRRAFLRGDFHAAESTSPNKSLTWDATVLHMAAFKQSADYLGTV